MWQPESRRLAAVLLISWSMVTAWCYFGSAEFFRAHGAPFELGGLSLDQRACAYEIVAAVLLLAVVPLACLKLIWGEPIASFGLGWGIPRRWILVTLVLLPVLAGIAWIGSASAELRDFYPRDRTAGDSLSAFARYAAARFFFYLAWEIHFRGFLQVEFSRQVGPGIACVFQAVACSWAHLRGPVNESIGALLGGLWWGVHARGSRCIWGTTLQHWFLGIAVDAMICWLG